MIIRGKKISDISAMHYAKLIFRSVLLVALTAVYIYGRMHGFDGLNAIMNFAPALFWIIASVFVIEMALRFFSSNIESPGCQKQFAFNYIPTGTTEKPSIDNEHGTKKVIVSWIALNAIFAVLFYKGIIDEGILILLCLVYSVCDMICILFFCPFQTWMMKNKCCGTCRIYNWDFIMMFTPCLMINHPMAKVLLFFSVALLIEWEYLYKKYPERFAENTNAYISCEHCTEKLCSHKVQLQNYLVSFRQRVNLDKEKAKEKIENF